jgi:catechol 2,3-dioxygenase-like lactoylglutathione lyase family enzyme
MTAEPTLLSGASRFAWIVVNVRDADRSKDYYERFTALRSHTRIGATDATAFGLQQASYTGYELRDSSEGSPCSVFLVQWLKPGPVGATYPSHTNPGYFRLCFQHPDAAALYEEVRAAGYEPLSPLRLPKPGRSTGRPVFSFRDLDGTVLEILTFPGEPRLYHVNCNTADLERADAFFDGIIGLECAVRSTTTEPEAHSFGPGGDLHTYDARLYRTNDNPGGPPRLLLDVVESTYPAPVGRAYDSPRNVGIARVAVEVDDVDAAYTTLVAAGVPGIDRAPETWDLGLTAGTRRVMTLRSPDGVPFDVVSAGA